MSDITCPYCKHTFCLDYAEGYGCSEDETYEEQCPECNKFFVFTTWIEFNHVAEQADCLNGGEHNWKATHSYPREFTKMRCVMCDGTRECTDGEKKVLGYWE